MMVEIDQTKLWYHPNLDVFLNRWFADYDQARAALEAEGEGEFLLPYQKHFFVCKAEVIQALGLDPTDPDWQQIGFDCARPGDAAAFERLRVKREQIVAGSMAK